MTEMTKNKIVKYRGARYQLEGPKVRVVQIDKGEYGMRLHLRFVDWPITMIWDAPTPRADVRIGDLLTIYTEIPINAEPQPTSVQ